MLDPIQTALSRIYNTIPKPILEMAFKAHDYEESLDTLIKREVLLSRVRLDASARCGKLKRFALDSSWAKYVNSPSPLALGIAGGSYSVFHVPRNVVENRNISCVVSVNYPWTFVAGTGTDEAMVASQCFAGNNASKLACNVLASITGAGRVATPTVRVANNNMLIFDPPNYNLVPYQITVRLELDDEFSNMEVSSLQPFAQLCEYAVKQYIYTNLIMEIETNTVRRGMEIGVVRSIVDTYNDAGEKYDELLIALGGADIFDSSRLKGILERMCPGR